MKKTNEWNGKLAKFLWDAYQQTRSVYRAKDMAVSKGFDRQEVEEYIEDLKYSLANRKNNVKGVSMKKNDDGSKSYYGKIVELKNSRKAEETVRYKGYEIGITENDDGTFYIQIYGIGDLSDDYKNKSRGIADAKKEIDETIKDLSNSKGKSYYAKIADIKNGE
jgi:hypothetical protein